jgi:hypothetical protein
MYQLQCVFTTLVQHVLTTYNIYLLFDTLTCTLLYNTILERIHNLAKTEIVCQATVPSCVRRL